MGFGIDYDTAKKLAASEDAAERRFIASRDDTRPEILFYLANDQSAEVRREIARNNATPRQADMLLVQDPDEGVRTGLAGKIAALVPSLGADKVGQLEKMALDILEALAKDQAGAVRQVLAETLKDTPNAPPHIVQQLARDLELSVSAPVLRHSPLLTDDDLLSIIGSQPLDGKLVAIAERAGVSHSVSDAVARTGSEAAVAALLGNASAQIREETLDRIIDMAPRHEPWHAPLVRRPALPAQAAARIAGFVNDQLVKVLESRADLPPEVRAAVRDAVKARIPAAAPRPGGGIETAEEEAPKERPLDRAKKLHAEGKLDEEAIASALTRGDRGLVMAALAVRTGYPLDAVDKIVGGQSPRGVTALCWKAKLSMRFCRQVQLRLAGIPPTGVLNAREGTHYPMTDAEMKWQLEFFGLKG
ncbi:DUF2336 domain-containing protein [Aerophototrophica crusticola]|uniref:DUF2336 domain-containing protein n=1 Tax=Aerophototrophica crusticola TaxID=1709002 RepID=A0A858R9C6_9PROT|nr:DUF2336 domain-containing protein [Rhodospirillaceae bacterium B3]